MYNRPEQTHLHQEFHCHRRPKLQKAPVHVSLLKIVTIMIFNYWFSGPGPNTKPGSKLCMFLSGSLSSLRIVSKTLMKIKKIQKQFQTIPTFFFSVSSVSSTATAAAFSFLSFFIDSFLWQAVLWLDPHLQCFQSLFHSHFFVDQPEDVFKKISPEDLAVVHLLIFLL